MVSLQSLVFSNRTADDSPAEGAQSRSPVAKIWRQVGQNRRGRPSFVPLVGCWNPVEMESLIRIKYLPSAG